MLKLLATSFVTQLISALLSEAALQPADWTIYNASEPCRHEDGLFHCEGKCVRRSFVWKYCRVKLTCTDDEVICDNRCLPRNEANLFREPCKSRYLKQEESIESINGIIGIENKNETTMSTVECDDRSQFSCHDSSTCIGRSLVMNGEADCEDASDELKPLTACHNRTEYRCAASGRCIPRYRVNDGFADCDSDENVTNFECAEDGEFRCDNRRCIPRMWVGNGVDDCGGGEDERVPIMTSCNGDEFQCSDKQRCLPRRYLCDGVQHCLDGSDEMDLCGSQPTMYRCSPQTNQLLPVVFLLQEALDYTAIRSFCTQGFELSYTALAIGFKCRVVIGTEVTTKRRHIPQVYLHQSHRNDIESVCLNGEDRCFDADKRENQKCSRCVDGSLISISQKCDGVIDCDDLSDECKCGGKSKAEPLCKQLYPPSPQNSSILCNGITDMDGGLDERFCDFSVMEFNQDYAAADSNDSCSNEESLFSSESEMIQNPFLRVFIWVSASVTIIANAIVIRRHIFTIRKISNRNTLHFANRYLLLNLALSDTLMGVALMLIGFKSAQLSGQYCGLDEEWRSSQKCSNIGVIVVTSSGASIDFLMLLTATRVFVTFCPFRTNQIPVKMLYLVSVFCWIKPFLLSVIPVLSSAFVHHYRVQVSNSSVEEQLVETWSVERYYEQADWNTTQIVGKFGYYSSTSVCFPEMYSMRSPASEYSLLLISFNLTCLLSITLGHLVVFYKTKKSKMSMGSERRQISRVRQGGTNLKIRITVIVATDMICWVPVILMSFISYAGHALPPFVQPLSAIIFLPINSSVNPVIFSRFDQLVQRMLLKLLQHRPTFRVKCKKVKSKVVEGAEMEELETNNSEENILNQVTNNPATIGLMT